MVARTQTSRFIHLIPLFIIVSIAFPLLRAAPAASAEAATETEPEFSGEIVIGATFPRTGFLEDYGLSAYYGANTCVRKINAEGGINGKKLVLEWRDNQSDSDLAAENVKEFVTKYKVPAVLGPLLSDATLAISPLAEEYGVVVISPMATYDTLAKKDTWVFRACFSNSAEADALVRFQRDKYGASSCAILYDPRYVFSREMARIYEETITMAGGRSVGTFSIVAENGDKDYVTPLTTIAEAAPDYIFAPCYALEATEMVHAARDLNVGIRFCGHNTWDNELVFDGSGTRLAGTAFASALFEQTFSRQFRDFFQAMEQAGMENPDASAACAYDAVTLLAHALRQGETAQEIREALLKVNNMTLATGRVTINPDGTTLKPVLIRVVERRGYRLVPVYAERYDPPRQRRRTQ